MAARCAAAEGSMDNLKLIGIRADELVFKLNNMRPAAEKTQIQPTFSRQVRHAVENRSRMFVTLTVKIESTAERPTPFDVRVTMTGVFDALAPEDGQPPREAVVAATALLYPYLRAAVTTLTTTAMSVPIVLPVVSGTLFPEDAAASGPVS